MREITFSSFGVRSLCGEKSSEPSIGKKREGERKEDEPTTLRQRVRKDDHHMLQHPLLPMYDHRLVTHLRRDEGRVVHRGLQLAEELGVSKFFGDVDGPGHGADEFDCKCPSSVRRQVGEDRGRDVPQAKAIRSPFPPVPNVVFSIGNKYFFIKPTS
jgi:hypothetical protein